MRRPLVTERYVLAEHSSNKNVVREDPEDSAEAAAPSKKTIAESATSRATTNVLPYGGLCPANYKECNVFLPTTPADHDLAGFLVGCVAPDENGDAVLHTGKVLACVKEEFKRYGIARKTFARKMAIRPSTFSMYLCDTERPWSSCGDAQKKFMLILFQWLNLELADRVGVFYEAAELLQRRDEKLDTLVESVPRVMLIVDTVRRELNSAGMTPKSLAGCVVRNVGPAAMENLINSPVLCWNLQPNWMKVCYGDLWFWLRKPSEERLSIVEAAECDKQPRHWTTRRRRLSTQVLGRHILALAAKCGKSDDFIRHISERVLHKNPEDLMRLLDTPSDWTEVDSESKQALVSLMKWLGSEINNGNDGKSQNAQQRTKQMTNYSFKKPWECGDLELVPLDTKVTAEALLRHPRGVAGLSRLVGAESRDLVPLLKDPVDWEAATQTQKSVYRAAWEWLKTVEETKIKRRADDDRPRQVRVRFTSEQAEYLKRMFELDAKPTTAAKDNMARKLGLPLRTVMVFFSNRRRRTVIEANGGSGLKQEQDDSMDSVLHT